MKKQPKKQSRLEELDQRQSEIDKRILQAYRAGMSHHLISQLEKLADENRFEIYNEIELEKHRRSEGNNDDDSYIV